MNIINNFSEIKQPINENKAVTNKQENAGKEYKPDILDIFSEKIVNKRDLNDTVTVPRSIFKGYLCFTAGTALNAISSMFDKAGKISKTLAITGSLVSIYGTFNFVKPFLIKEKDLTKEEK